MGTLNLTPNLDEARAFLDWLDPDGKFTFQTFDDNSARKDRAQAKILHGTLNQHADFLVRLQQLGAGVFAMINEGDGLGRAAVNVVRVRGHFVDLDNAPLAPVTASDAPPHIVVESSPDKWHAYWHVDGCPLDAFKSRQQMLAARFGGDPSVCDLPRVLRVPGFWHQKGAPFQTRLHAPSLKGWSL